MYENHIKINVSEYLGKYLLIFLGSVAVKYYLSFQRFCSNFSF